MHSEHDLPFGDYLRHLRERVGLTQAALAEKAGLSTNAVSALERGERRQPHPQTVHALAEALGLAPHERSGLLAARYGQRAQPTLASQPPAPAAPPPVALPDLHEQHNLPMQVSSFVGRQAEMQEVLRLLRAHRLVTLTGAGGSGKTRLALAVATQRVAFYPDGVWLVEFAGLTDAALVPDAIARALGLREEAGTDRLSALQHYLRQRALLLVLDNCEHVIGMCATVVEGLLATCPRLAICTTSREVLRVPGEFVYLVPTLPVPAPGQLLAMEDTQRYDAVQLFLERATAHQPAFRLATANASAVVEICWRLDGIPLAIELAAARIRSMSPQQVVERLHNSLRLLTEGSRTALPRQQTLRGTLDWSYTLLDEPQRRLLRRMSVFLGGWDLEAAEVVGATYAPHAARVADLLARLAEQSLVVVDDVQSEQGGGRYHMLEPVRQYAAQLLEESGEMTEIRRRHSAIFLVLAQRGQPELRGTNQVLWLDKFEREHDNLRAAIGWAISSGDFEAAAGLGWALWPFWWIRNHQREGRRWLEAVLAQRAQTSTLLYRRALMAASAMAYGAADGAAVDHYSLLLMELSTEAGGDSRAEGYAQAGFGLMAASRGDLDAALEHLNQALPLFQQSDEAGMASQSYTWIGTVLLLQGDYAGAELQFKTGLAAARAIGDRLGMTNALFNLGQLALATGEYQAATDWLRAGIPLSNELNDRGNVAFILEGLAVVAVAGGHYERGARLFGAAEGIIERIGLRGHTYYQPDRALYERSTETLRTQLGAAAFASALVAGRSLPFAQAVAYALEE